jgi:hypothetical protein
VTTVHPLEQGNVAQNLSGFGDAENGDCIALPVPFSALTTRHAVPTVILVGYK